MTSVVGLLAVTSTSAASSLTAGSLDPTYGSGGAVLDDFYGTQDPDQANAVAIQPGGKIVIAGSSGSGHITPIAMVARYNANGTRDMSFGPPPHGFLLQQVCFSSSCGQAEADALAIMPNGDIVVAGVAVSNDSFFVVRLTPTGSLDSSFAGAGGNSSGIDAFQLGSVTTGYHVGGVAVQADGDIVVDGTFGSTPEGFIARVKSAGGALDSGWNGGLGYSTEASDTTLSALALQPSNGEAVAVGSDRATGAVLIARFTTAGTADTTFHGSGVNEASIGLAPDTGTALVATSDGRLIVAGTDQTGATAGIGLFQFNQSNGALDMSFAGGAGDERIALPGGDAGTVTGLALDTSGRLLVAGQDTTRQHLFVARLSAGGALDGSFGSGGFSTPSIAGSDGAQAVTSDAAGNPVVAGFGIAVGRSDTDALTARMLGSTPPPSGGGAPPPVAPTLSRVSQSHSKWREGSALAALARAIKPTLRHRPKAPIGTTFSFTLNEPATVTLAFLQQQTGRRVSGRCVRQTRRNHRKASCTYGLSRGTLILVAHSGLNRVSFQGRINRSHKLPVGAYAVTITARASGKTSIPKTLRFTIVH